MNCNNSQLAAINHKEGPALVLAGPGSGKTTVITERTRKLINEYGINPLNILVVTFTRAAALQMKERFLKLIRSEKTQVTFGTFHSVFFTIIKYAYNYTVNDILSEEEKYNIVMKLLEANDVETEDENELIPALISEISRVKGDGIKVENFYSKCIGEEVFRDIFNDYEKMLRQKNKLDFDDMLLITYELLSERRDILAQWQKRYQYILIDEFQDINRIQYEVVKLLAAPQDNVFAVGDDDQSIYGFRGAKPELMKAFEKDFKNVRRILLDVNYRSTDEIIETAIKLINHNTGRYIKKIKGNFGAGDTVKVLEYENLSKENEAIIEDISKYIEMGGDYKDVAILYRTNVTPRGLIEKFIEYNIPFVAKDVIPNIYEHFIFRHIKAYIDIALGSRKRKDFLEIANKPKRYISRDCLDRETIEFDRLRALYDDKNWMIERIDKWEEDITYLRDMTPYAAINYIRRGIGYDEFIYEYSEQRKINTDDLFDILVQLQDSARDYNSYEEWFLHIEEYNKRLKEEFRENEFGGDCVTFSTMHGAKGLEYEVVYIIDANEGITPHHKSVLDVDIEEERRMFYVAMTRAKRQLKITYTRERYNKKMPVSRFVREILEGEPSYV